MSGPLETQGEERAGRHPARGDSETGRLGRCLWQVEDGAVSDKQFLSPFGNILLFD